MKKALKYLFVAWGILSLIGAVAGAGCLIYLLSGNSKPRGAQTDFATESDVRLVLINGHFIGDHKHTLEHSYRAERSLIGERCEAYAIKLDAFPEELLKPDAVLWPTPYWIVGPPTNSILVQAIDAASSAAKEYGPAWFPSATDLKSDRFYICFRQVKYDDNAISAALILCYDRQKNMLYSIGFDG